MLFELIAWAYTFATLGLFVYTAVVALAFQLRVVYGEEPWLLENHGASWREYGKQVPRWSGAQGKTRPKR